MAIRMLDIMRCGPTTQTTGGMPFLLFPEIPLNYGSPNAHSPNYSYSPNDPTFVRPPGNPGPDSPPQPLGDEPSPYGPWLSFVRLGWVG
jgi:hypothetical protein